MKNLKRAFLHSASPFVILPRLPKMTPEQYAYILGRAYLQLGLNHLTENQ